MLERVLKSLKVSSLIVLFFCFSAITNADAEQNLELDNNLFDIISSNENLDLFAKSLKKSKVFEIIQQKGPYTVFVSTNDAFNRASFSSKFKVWTDEELLKNVVNFHIVEGVWSLEALKQVSELTTVQGSAVKIAVENANVLVGNAPIIATDVTASNGVLHIVSEIIERPDF